MAAEVAQSTVIKEFASLEDAQLYSQTHPEATPFVFYITGNSNILYNSFTNEIKNYEDMFFKYIEGSLSADISIPGNITYIRSGAFWNCDNITSVTIPNSVTAIGWRLFQQCPNLTSVSFPDSIVTKDITGYCLHSCPSLTTVRYISNSSITRIDQYEFYGCSSMSTFTMTNTNYITTVGTYAFYNCSSLTSLNFPNLATINAYSFYGCSSLTTTGTTKAMGATIQNYAFYGCAALHAYNTSTTTTVNTYAFYGSGITEITPTTFPKLVTIFNYAFANCKSLTKLQFPTTVTATGMYNNNNANRQHMFEDCSNLTEVDLSLCAATGLAAYMFCRCTSLTNEKITLKPTTTTFQANCFDGCTGLTSPFWPPNGVSMGTGVFIRCNFTKEAIFNYIESRNATVANSLKITTLPGWTFYANNVSGDLVIPAYITAVGAACFGGCPITSCKYLGPVTTVNARQFEACTSLVTVDLPSTITTMTASNGQGCFQNCSSLTTIILRATTPPAINAYTFQGIKTGGKIYVPKGSLATYQAVAGWYTTNSNYWPKKMGWTLHELDANGNIPS